MAGRQAGVSAASQHEDAGATSGAGAVVGVLMGEPSTKVAPTFAVSKGSLGGGASFCEDLTDTSSGGSAQCQIGGNRNVFGEADRDFEGISSILPGAASSNLADISLLPLFRRSRRQRSRFHQRIRPALEALGYVSSARFSQTVLKRIGDDGARALRTAGWV